MKALTIARFTLREASRKRIILGALILTAGFLLLFGVGTYFAFQRVEAMARISPAQRSFIAGQILVAGMYVTNLVGSLLAILVATGTISSEVDQGTLYTIVPKPLRRRDIVLGKWLGLSVMIAIYVLATSAIMIGLVYVMGGYFPERALPAVALVIFEALLLLTIALLGSTLMSTVASGIVTIMLFAVATIGGKVEQLGSLIGSDIMVNIGIVTSLLIPADSLSWLATTWLTPSTTASLSASPDLARLAPPPSLWMIAYAALYMGAALLLAIRVFQRKDL